MSTGRLRILENKINTITKIRKMISEKTLDEEICYMILVDD